MPEMHVLAYNEYEKLGTVDAGMAKTARVSREQLVPRFEAVSACTPVGTCSPSEGL